ncbi:Plasmodium vivax Vir protein, putative [Plasmodium vivax]|nr:Plasmodium vivax Vir protein, putative [Plasmodium vivax]
MSEKILDIETWKTEYPFLIDVWTTYNNFDKTVEDSGGKHFSLCNLILQSMYVEGTEHNDFCMRLMRNLGYFSEEKQIYAPTVERCNILKNWIYNSIKNNKITDDIINRCFIEYTEHMTKRKNDKICYIDAYDDNYKERIYMTVLHIFENNVHTISNVLNGHDEESKIRGRKFVCDCLKIYKYMNLAHCHNKGYRQEELTGTCLKLSHFESSYILLGNSINSINLKIPSLYNIDSECLDKRPSLEQKSVLALLDQGDASHRHGNVLRASAEDQDSESPETFSGPIVNEDSSMKKTITTTIGTFAGASSLLALLYRFTPAGRLVNPQLRTTTGIMNNNFYGEEANGMLFDGNEHNRFNSYNIGYEAV